MSSLQAVALGVRELSGILFLLVLLFALNGLERQKP